MLDVKLGTKGQDHVGAGGEFGDIVSELLCTVLSVYQALAKTDKKAAELFRAAIQVGVTSPELWNRDIPGVIISRHERMGE